MWGEYFTFTLSPEWLAEVDENGNLLPAKRVFEKDRSQRLHWINYYIHELVSENIEVFSVTECDRKKRCDVTKTYIYDKKEKYVIVLECQRKSSYCLLTAYYLNKEYAEKGIKKKMKKRLPNFE